MYIYLIENKSPSTSSTTPEKTREISSIVHTTCSPFKVTFEDNYQSLLIPDEPEGIVFSSKYVTCLTI